MIIQLFQHHSFSISLFSYWFDMPFSSFTKVLNFLMFHWIFLSSLYQYHNGMDASVYSSMSIFFLSTIDSLFFIGIWKWTCLFIDLGKIGIFLYSSYFQEHYVLFLFFKSFLCLSGAFFWSFLQKDHAHFLWSLFLITLFSAAVLNAVYLLTGCCLNI